MKKTITLAALALGFAASAFAAEPVYSLTWTEEGLDLVTSEGTSDTVQNALTAFGNAFSHTEGNAYAQVGNGTEARITSNFGSFGGDFTLSFDVKAGSDTSPGTYKTLASISSMGVGKDAHSLQLQYSGTAFVLYNMNESYGHTSASGTTTEVGRYIVSYAGMTDWVNFCIVSDVSNSTLTLYVDGVSMGSISDWGPRESVSSDDFSPTGLAFGTSPDGARDFSADALINNIRFYDSAVPIPEPATATLSLLALAGLATRRRRK